MNKVINTIIFNSLIQVNETLNKKYILLCTECGSSGVHRDITTGEFVCKECGIVLHSTCIDRGAEWRVFTLLDMEKRSRVGLGETWRINDKGLSTNIGWNNRDAKGRNLSPESASRLHRLRRLQRRNQFSGSVNRSLSYALVEMNNLSESLNLPETVIETASLLYRSAFSANLIYGRKIQSIVAACVYMACRQCEVLRTIGDIATISNLGKKELSRSYRFLVRALGSKVPKSDPRTHVSKIVNSLDMTGEVERVASELVDYAFKLKLTGGRGPSSIAAASVYVGSVLVGESRTQSEIAEKAQVTRVTIRTRYKELLKYLDIDILV